MGYFPRFFAKKIEFVWQFNVVYYHPAGNVREVEFLAVMGTEQMLGFAKMGRSKVFKVFQYFNFIAMKGGYPKLSVFFTLNFKITHRNTYYFTKLCPNTGAFVKVFCTFAFFSLVLRFKFPKCLFGGV